VSEKIDIRDARRLALVAAGLLRPNLIGLPTSVSGAGLRAKKAAHALINHFGYLQLDTVSVAGARSHCIVLHSRWPRLDPSIGETLLTPEAPVFEYWGHEACWIPLDLYPHFEFRRVGFRNQPWAKRALAKNPGLDRELLERVRNEGAIRSLDLEGKGAGGWWGHKPAKRIAVLLWSTGELAIRERQNFQRTFDVAERVIPPAIRRRSGSLSLAQALPELLYRALAGHGWAQTGTLASTWRIRNRQKEVEAALATLCDQGRVVPCTLQTNPRDQKGWIRTDHLGLLSKIRRLRIDPTDSRLLSPFDPLIWDRRRTLNLFGFDYTIEIFKPKVKRVFGYYSLPILAGEFLIGRTDLKADRRKGELRILSHHREDLRGLGLEPKTAKAAESIALQRFADAMELDLTPS